MKNIEDKLKEKGWTKKDIRHSLGILKRSRKIVLLDKLMAFFIALVIIAATFTVSLFLVPFIIVMDASFLFFLLIFVLGFTVGIIFEFLLYELESFEKKHHILFTIIVPLVTIINIFIIVHISNTLIDQLQLIKPHQNSVLIAGIYTIAFLIPYIVFHIKNKK